MQSTIDRFPSGSRTSAPTPSAAGDERRIGATAPRTERLAAARRAFGSLLGRTTLVAFAATAGAAHAQALDVVRFGAAAMGMPQGPILMAGVAPEIYAKHGIELRVTDMRGSATNTIVGQLRGDFDVASNGAGFVMDAIAEGADLKAISITVRPMTDVFLSTKTVQRLGVKPTDPIDARVKALKGLRIGSNGGTSSSHWLNLYQLMQRAGMAAEDVQLRNLSDLTAMVASIRNDQIDGGMWSTGGLSGLLADRSGVRWITLSREDAPDLFDVPFSAMWASSQWIEKNPDVARRLVAAFDETVRLMKTEKAKYSPMIKAKYFPAMDQALWDDTYEQSLPAYVEGGKQNKAGWDKLIQQRVAVTKKDYSRATFERSVASFAQAR